MRLTPEAEDAARQLAMRDDDGQDALVGALLGSRTATTSAAGSRGGAMGYSADPPSSAMGDPS